MNKGTALGGAAFVLAAGLVVQQLVVEPDQSTPASAPPVATADVSALQAKLRALEERVANLEAGTEDHTSSGAATAASSPAVGTQPSADPAKPQPASAETSVETSEPAPSSTKGEPEVTKTVLAAVDERINEAVDEKLEEIQQKWNKKPKLETVAKLLELDERQQRVIEEEVREGQKQIRSILDQPTADGTSLLNELVEVMAHGQTAEAGALWGKWLRRLQTEKVPGTDLTYAARLEQAKAGVRDGFRQVMSPEQYTEFEEWAFDPTEVEGISESPWEEFGQRVAARAAELAKQRQE
jgi:hypothetical protein